MAAQERRMRRGNRVRFSLNPVLGSVDVLNLLRRRRAKR